MVRFVVLPSVFGSLISPFRDPRLHRQRTWLRLTISWFRIDDIRGRFAVSTKYMKKTLLLFTLLTSCLAFAQSTVQSTFWGVMYNRPSDPFPITGAPTFGTI